MEEGVVVDGDLITSRWPMDLPVFMREVLRALRERRRVATE
jgi:putative intracellular protease/amidase